MVASLSEVLIGGVIGAFGTLAAVGLSVWLPRRYAERDRTHQETTRLRETGAAALEPVRNLLLETNPQRLLVNAGPHSKGEFEEYWERWRLLRDPLMTFATAQPSRAVLVTALNLREAVERAFHSTMWAVHDLLTNAPSLETLNQAERDYEEAVKLAHALRWEIRGEGEPSRSLYERRYERR